MLVGVLGVDGGAITIVGLVAFNSKRRLPTTPRHVDLRRHSSVLARRVI